MANEKEVFGPGGFSRFVNNLQTRFFGKYDKTGGEITGNVVIDGNLTLDISDEDYDAGIRFTKVLDDNLGTILTLTGYANANGNNTNYKTLLRNIATPNSNYDAANKQYVDEMSSVPRGHLVELNADGSVALAASTLVYRTILANLTDPKKSDYLDVFWENGVGSGEYTRFKADAVGISEVNAGNIQFVKEFKYLGVQRYILFELDSTNTLTTTGLFTWQSIHQKTDDIVGNSTSSEMYPSTKAVFDQFQRKPVIVWQDDTGLKALQTDIAASMNWQLTGLDLTPFRRIKVYAKAGRGSTNAGTTGQMMVEMLLDSRCADTSHGGHYVGSVLSQKPNDSNRYASLTVAVSADKTSFAVLRQTSLYGTAATTNNDIGANVFLIEGYYD